MYSETTFYIAAVDHTKMTSQTCHRLIHSCEACRVRVRLNQVRVNSDVMRFLCQSHNWPSVARTVADTCSDECLYILAYDLIYHEKIVYDLRASNYHEFRSLSKFLSLHLCIPSRLNSSRVRGGLAIALTISIIKKIAHIVVNAEIARAFTSDGKLTGYSNFVLTSPNYPRNYVAARELYMWSIISSEEYQKKSTIVLEFVDWNIPSNGSSFTFKGANVRFIGKDSQRQNIYSHSGRLDIIFDTGDSPNSHMIPGRLQSFRAYIYVLKPSQNNYWARVKYGDVLLNPNQPNYQGFVEFSGNHGSFDEITIIPPHPNISHVNLRLLVYHVRNATASVLIKRGLYSINFTIIHMNRTRTFRSATSTGFYIRVTGSFSRRDIINMSYTYIMKAYRNYKRYPRFPGKSYICRNSDEISANLTCDGVINCIRGSDEFDSCGIFFPVNISTRVIISIIVIVIFILALTTLFFVLHCHERHRATSQTTHHPPEPARPGDSQLEQPPTYQEAMMTQAPSPGTDGITNVAYIWPEHFHLPGYHLPRYESLENLPMRPSHSTSEIRDERNAATGEANGEVTNSREISHSRSDSSIVNLPTDQGHELNNPQQIPTTSTETNSGDVTPRRKSLYKNPSGTKFRGKQHRDGSSQMLFLRSIYDATLVNAASSSNVMPTSSLLNEVVEAIPMLNNQSSTSVKIDKDVLDDSFNADSHVFDHGSAQAVARDSQSHADITNVGSVDANATVQSLPEDSRPDVRDRDASLADIAGENRHIENETESLGNSSNVGRSGNLID